MELQFTMADGKVMVNLDGNIYAEEAAILRERLFQYVDAGYIFFQFDARNLNYIDSSGLGVLIAIHKRTLQLGGKVEIFNLRGVVNELFELTRLSRVFDIKES